MACRIQDTGMKGCHAVGAAITFKMDTKWYEFTSG